MAIVFPASPSVNDTFTAGSITYKWDGDKWIGLGVTPADRLVEGSNSLEINANDDLVWTGNNLLLVDSAETTASLFINSTKKSSWQAQDNFGTILYSYDGEPIIFSTSAASSFSEKLRITTDGNVGIGHSTPASKLTIGEDAITTAKPTVMIADTTNGASLVLRGLAPRLSFDQTGGNTPKILTDAQDLKIYAGTLDADSTLMATISAGGNITPGSALYSDEFFSKTTTNDDSTSNIAFRPRNAAGGAPAASLRVGVSGQCYIPAGGVTYAMRVGHDTGTTYASGEHGMIAFAGAADSFTYMAGRNVADGTPALTADVGGTRQFEIEADGDMFNINGTYGQISDAKLKENIVDAGSQWDDIKALRVRNFNFREDLGYDPKTQIGFVAQEVEEVSSGLVKTNPDKDLEGNDLGTETKVLRMSVLHIKAVKALQEAMERIEELEARLEAAGI